MRYGAAWDDGCSDGAAKPAGGSAAESVGQSFCYPRKSTALGREALAGRYGLVRRYRLDRSEIS